MNQKAFLKLKGLERGLSRFKGRQIEGIVQLRIAREGWMEKIIRGRFDKESTRSYGGQKWKEKAKDDGKPILVDTGVLKRASEQAVFGTYRIRGRTIWDIGRIGLPYAIFVQQTRPFFWNPDKKELKTTDTRANNLVAREIRKAMRR